MNEKEFYKIIVFSDSHGNYKTIEKILPQINSADYCFFLGDGAGDIERVRSKINTRFYMVKGNNDFFFRGEKVITEKIGDVNFLFTHGDLFGVKNSLVNLRSEVIKRNCSFAFYGHTHCSSIENIDNINLICPGAICGNYNSKPSYCEIVGDGKFFSAQIIEIDK